ncbi:MAG: flagellar hook-basal body complex protein FliE [Thermoplasmata archaeon]|nr:MAG: flagellar hook-basal body complex protein FliE [Thermoplasmata archaeon]MCD6108153.1 flagellar hook-basal body complex protein FliE [Thermoplasmata archaeon]RLF60887.1 MAG: dephospho-CoA kinase [Thermoplasmata archaeon]
MRVIAFTGLPFSGKTEAVNVAREMGINVIRMGDFVWEEVKKRGLELNDKNVGRIANELREKYGREIWAKRTVEKIKEIKNMDSLVIDGIRNSEEVDYFKKKLGRDFILIAIHAPKNERIKRALSRRRDDDVKDIEEFEKREKRELKWGLDSVIASSDVIITNDESLDKFRSKMKNKLMELIKENR